MRCSELARGTLALGFVALVSACASSDDPLPAISLPPSSWVVGAYELPLDPVLHPANADATRVNSAVETEIVECMKERGVPYEPAPYIGETMRDRYSLVDAARASTQGYRLSTGDSELGSSHIPTELYTKALFGTTEGAQDVIDSAGRTIGQLDPSGCAPQANEIVRPHWIRAFELREVFEKVEARSFEEAALTNEVLGAWSSWSKCMEERGYVFANPWAPFYSVWPGNSPGREELETAEADVACKAEVDLLAIWSQKVAENQYRALQDEELDVQFDELTSIVFNEYATLPPTTLPPPDDASSP